MAVLLLQPLAVLADEAPATVEIRVDGAGGKGPVIVALFASAAAFEQQAGAAASATVMPDAAGTATVGFMLPPGRYAVAAYQDKDGNGRLSSNFVGMPTEPYGFSGQPAKYGPPAFEAAALDFPVPAPVLVSLRSLW